MGKIPLMLILAIALVTGCKQDDSSAEPLSQGPTPAAENENKRSMDEAMELIKSKLSEESVRVTTIREDGVDQEGNYIIRQSSKATTEVLERYHVNPVTGEVRCEKFKDACLKNEDPTSPAAPGTPGKSLTDRQRSAQELAKQFAKTYLSPLGYADGLTYVELSKEEESKMTFQVWNPGAMGSSTIDWLTVDLDLGKVEAMFFKTPAPAALTPAPNDWAGNWSWDQANEYYDSRITIYEWENGIFNFNLDAHRITNPEKSNVHIGNIDKGTAVMKGNTASYTDGKFKLEMRLVDGKLQVTANEGEVGYFGAGVMVSGTYSKSGDPTVKDDAAQSLCLKNESLLFGFPVKDSGKLLSLCAATDQDSLTYRFGKPDQVELEFPAEQKNSWQQFEYSYLLRGGGDNDGLDLNSLTFTNGSYTYEIYDEYNAKERQSSVGIRVTDSSTKKVTELEGSSDKKQGSLIKLRGSPVKEVPYAK